MQYASTKLPLPFRLVNTLGAVPGVAKLAGVRLEVDALLNAATRQTGLSNFGDPAFLEGLQILLRSLKRDAKLHFIGHFSLHQVIVDSLVNRLLLVETRKRNPELFTQPLIPPLIVLGLARSGTTYLHRMLAEDPAHYAPRYWELSRPLRHPGKRDNRRELARRELGLRKRMTNDLDHKHFITADTPEEDLIMLAPTLDSPLFWVLAPVYGYLDWYLAQDHKRKYQEYRAWLQVLQASVPGRRLVLKAPEHTGSLVALLDAVPEALLIQTHRDPVEAFASYTSLSLTTQGLATDTIDVQQNAAANLRFFEEEVRHNLRARTALPGAVHDVLYSDLVADPRGVVQRIYQHYQLAFTDAYQKSLDQYIQENPQGKHGTHHYAASAFGFSNDMVRARFTAYNERFGFAA